MAARKQLLPNFRKIASNSDIGRWPFRDSHNATIPVL